MWEHMHVYMHVYTVMYMHMNMNMNMNMYMYIIEVVLQFRKFKKCKLFEVVCKRIII